jgi:hypothetical protein
MELEVGDRVTGINRNCRGIIKHIDRSKRNALYSVRWLFGPNKGEITEHIRSKIYHDGNLDEIEDCLSNEEEPEDRDSSDTSVSSVATNVENDRILEEEGAMEDDEEYVYLFYKFTNL